MRTFYLKEMMLLTLVLAFVSCTGDEIANNIPGTDSKRMMTLHVNTPSDNNPETRIAYQDNSLKLTWQTEDKIAVLGFNSGTYKGHGDYTYSGEDGATSGDFTGSKIGEATSYNIYYPSTVTIGENGSVTSFNMDEQTQTGNNNTDHLKDYILLEAVNVTDLNNNIKLEMKSSILKFELFNIPTEVGTLNALVWETGTEAETKSMTLNLKDIPLDNQSLTAYLSFIPEEMSVETNGTFTVTLIGSGNYYKKSIQIEGGKEYQPGHRYTAEISEWEQVSIEIGDFYLKNGTLVGKGENLTDAQKANCIGIVYWLGDIKKDNYGLLDEKFPSGMHGLVVSLWDMPAPDNNLSVKMTWTYGEYEDVSDWLAKAQWSNRPNGFTSIQKDEYQEKMQGYANTIALKEYNKHVEVKYGLDSEYYVKPVKGLDAFETTHPAPSSSSGWYWPSVDELKYVCWGQGATSGTDGKDMLNDKIKKVNGNVFDDVYYWSSTEGNSKNNAYSVTFDDGVMRKTSPKLNSSYYVRPLLAF